MQTPRPALVVSIHDVSPLTLARVAQIAGDLAKAGVSRISLLVIPEHHGKGASVANREFRDWITARQARGDEIVIHGYFHLRPSGGSWLGRLTTECYTAGEGEFYDLPEAEATARLARARADFAQAGWKFSGFIAPAWLLGAGAESAARRAGFVYTTRIGSVKDLAAGREYHSQSLVWSARSRWRRALSLGWNALLARRLAGKDLVRVGVHPVDWDFPLIRSQILRLIRAALASREPMTYEGWLALRRGDS